MNLYLFNTIVNTIWYIFTVIFLLYKFTSFFSYIYNFLRFCGKLWTWIEWTKDQIVFYIRKRQGYTTLGDNEEYFIPTQSQTTTFFGSVKTQCKRVYNSTYKWVFGKYPDSQQHILPLHESQRESFILRPPTEQTRDKQLENELFDKQLRDLCSNDSDFHSIILTEPVHSSNPTQFQEDTSTLMNSNFITKTLGQNVRRSEYIPLECVANGSVYLDSISVRHPSPPFTPLKI